MARDITSCPSGLKPYVNKAAAQDANPGAPVKRCDRCRLWHFDAKKAKARRSRQKRGAR